MSLSYRGGSREQHRYNPIEGARYIQLEESTGVSANVLVVVLILLLAVAVGWLLWALFHPHSVGNDAQILNQTSLVQSLVDAFARTVTQQDWRGNAALFVAGNTSLANFRRAMTFLPAGDLVVDSGPIIAPVGTWRHQLEVYAGGFSSNHMALTNCNMSFWRSTMILTSPLQSSVTCIATYAYTLSYSISVNTSAYPTVMTHFQVHFDAVQNPAIVAPHFGGWQFTYALALPNATTTLLSSVDTGVAPPGAVTTRRRDLTDPSVVWYTLQDQIQALVENEQIQLALAICKTMQYQDLAALYDQGNTNTSLLCNTLQPAPVYVYGPLTCPDPAFAFDASCLPDRIRTINSIVPELSVPVMPNSLDFTITGGVGIAVVGGMHGITIHNVGIAVLNLVAPFPFYFTKVLSFISPSITLNLNNTAANTVWAGPVSGPDAPPAFRLLELSDIPLIDLATHVNGTLPLANGGTGNAGPFAGGRIIVSNAGGTQLVEAPAMGDGFFPVSDGAGNFVAGTIVPGDGINISYSGGVFTIIDLETQTVIQVDLAVPTDIFQVTSSPILVNGTLTFVTLPQGANKVWIGPISGPDAVPTFRVLQEDDMAVISLTGAKVSGILPVSRGGTANNGSTWVGERVIMSDSGGASLTEAIVTGAGGIAVTLGPGPSLVISGTGGTCSANDTISQSCLDISTLPCPGGALAASCIPSTLTLAALTVTGPASLGTSTTCAAPLSAPCYDISGQSCPGGYLNGNCIDPNLVLSTLTVGTITANDIMLLNGTITVTGVSDFEAVNTTTLYVSDIVLSGSMTCSPEDTISQNCYDISGISCSTPILSNCFPVNITLADASVTNNLNVNSVTCLGMPLGNDCIPSRVRTINGISPSAAPTLDFSITAGTGVSITPAVNGITIANTGVTSVGLSLPASILSVTISPITTTGTLTAVLQSQTANTFWGAPDGTNGTPSFRSIVFADLPTNASLSSVYFVDGAGILDVAPLSISLSVPTAEFALTGSPITNPTGVFSITKQTQLARTVWAGPLSGGAAQPTFRTLALSDLLPLGLTNGQVLTGVTAGAPVGKTLVAGLNMMITETSGSFVFDASNTDSFTNLTITVPGWLSVSPTTLYSSGTFDITANTQAAHTFLAGPTSGGPAVPSFRVMGYGDLPALADGQLYIGQTGSPPVPTQLTAGTLISVVPGPGTSTIATTALGMVTLTMPTAEFNVSTSFGPNSETITVTYDNQTANTFFAGPSSGGAGQPSFRPLVTADLPVAILLSYLETTNATSESGFNAGVYTIVPGMVLTPPAGVHWCSFSSSVLPTTSSGFFDIALFLNGILQPHTVRHMTGSSSYYNPHTLAVISTPGDQNVDIRWIKTMGAGSATITERSLYCLRIG